ncbi:MAG: DUF2568 domain-containing protein [Nakamurella sp.]
MTSSTATPVTPRQHPGTPETPLEWIAGTGAFAVEIALGVTWGVVGYRLGSRIAGPVGGWIGVVIAVVALVAVWSTWMSPNADHRLGLTGRLVLGCGLILLAAAAAWLTGSTTWALILGVGGIAVTVAAQVLLD